MSSQIQAAILYEDAHILAVNKPAEISVIHDSHHQDDPNLVDWLESRHGRLWVVHRLDRETSGALLFARSAAAHKKINDQFQARRVKKEYELLAYGAFNWGEKSVVFPLRVDGDRQHRTIIDFSRGKPARTDFSVLQTFDHSISWVKAVPLSGYTHQIRAHLSALNGCLLYETIYQPHPFPLNSSPRFDPSPFQAWVKNNLPIHRLALHACQIELIHPEQNIPIIIQAPYPEDFENALPILKTKSQA